MAASIIQNIKENIRIYNRTVENISLHLICKYQKICHQFGKSKFLKLMITFIILSVDSFEYISIVVLNS